VVNATAAIKSETSPGHHGRHRSNTRHRNEPTRTISRLARILADLTVTLLASVTAAPHAGTPERMYIDAR
jgi:hypothetical protein